MKLHFQIFLAGIQSKIHKYIDSEKEMKEMWRNRGKYEPDRLCQIDWISLMLAALEGIYQSKICLREGSESLSSVSK